MNRFLLAALLVAGFGAIAHAELKIESIRASYSPLGPDRKDDPVVVAPLEELLFRYRITGVAVDNAGAMNCTLKIRVVNADGEEVIPENRSAYKGLIALGGNEFPGHARVQFGANTPEGKYKIVVALTDEIGGKSAEFTREVTLKKQSGMILAARRFFADPDGKIPSSLSGTIDQRLFFRMQLVGFDRSKKKVKVRMEMEVVDKAGKGQLPRPLTAVAGFDKEEEVEKINVVNFTGNVVLNRAGDFALRFKFTDELGGSTVTYEVPLKVTE